ncbi:MULTISPECIES: hypothetical protein [Virgibacillus]|nr:MULTISPECIES: hypothetical protein [Virgibacillus]AIF45702.1 hypothetical protein X953_19490 [Virgibacillus sp. SK37]MEC2157652.1 hypothetical protein [Virgibacillus halodenitrificans]WHX25643.1 hypothetical protein QNH47_16135 [Virgibacillus halodenitrificans]
MLRKWVKLNMYVFVLPFAFALSFLGDANGNLVRLTLDTARDM